MKEYIQREREKAIDIDTEYTQEEILKRWENLGFLDTLSLEDPILGNISLNEEEMEVFKIKMANEFEKMAIRLIKDDIEYFDFIKNVAVFPAIRKILTYNEIYNKEIENLDDIIIDTFLENYSLYKGFKSIAIKNNNMEDFETQFIVEICNIVVDKLTN